MSSEPVRVLLHLDKDVRLVAAVGAAVARLAESAGFDARAKAELTAAAEEASRDTLSLLSETGSRLRVCLEKYSDRFEVTLEYSGPVLPAARLEHLLARAGKEPDRGAPPLLSRVDRVVCDTQGSAARVALIKYLHASSSSK